MSIESIKARLEAATPGPWKAGPSFCTVLSSGPDRCYLVCETEEREDREFIAHAPQDIAALLKIVEAVRELAYTIGADDRERRKWERSMFAALDELEDLK